MTSQHPLAGVYAAADDLSRKASAIIRILTDADDAHRDLGLLYAPSECYGDVNRAIQKRIQELFQDDFEEAKKFVQECEERTSKYYVFNMGLDIRDFFPEWMQELSSCDNDPNYGDPPTEEKRFELTHNITEILDDLIVHDRSCSCPNCSSDPDPDPCTKKFKIAELIEWGFQTWGDFDEALRVYREMEACHGKILELQEDLSKVEEEFEREFREELRKETGR